VGRTDEVERLAGELPSRRLVTLVGPGGVGKTRLSIEVAGAVCGQAPLASLDVFDLLGSLVDKSLVLVDRDTGRYRLLETLRQYGVEQLEARAEADALRTRHLAHVLEVCGGRSPPAAR
jgi:predicted ATPase